MVWASKCAWVLVLWLSLAVLHGEGAQLGAPAPSPSVDCTSAILSLADCLSFVEKGSNATKPQGQCCSGLKEVVKEDVACLCDVFKESSNLGINLNFTKALTLPSACGISTPPFSKCNISIAGVPVPAPAPSPTAGAPSAPGSGSTVPAPTPGKSGAPSAPGSGSTVPAPTPAKSGVRALPVPSFVLGAAAAVALCFYYI